MIFIIDCVQAHARPMPPAPGELADDHLDGGRVLEFLDATGSLVRVALPKDVAHELGAELVDDQPRVVRAPASFADAARRGPQQ